MNGDTVIALSNGLRIVTNNDSNIVVSHRSHKIFSDGLYYNAVELGIGN